MKLCYSLFGHFCWKVISVSSFVILSKRLYIHLDNFQFTITPVYSVKLQCVLHWKYLTGNLASFYCTMYLHKYRLNSDPAISILQDQICQTNNIQMADVCASDVLTNTFVVELTLQLVIWSNQCQSLMGIWWLFHPDYARMAKQN